MLSNKLVFVSFLAGLTAIIFCKPLQTYHNTYTPKQIQERFGEWAIIAGASGEGLGAAWADVCCSNGLNVLLIGRRQQAMTKLVRKLQTKYPETCQIDTFVQDLSDRHLQEKMLPIFEDSDRNYGLLIYNAADAQVGFFVDTPLERLLQSVDVNIRNVLVLCHMFVTQLLKKKNTAKEKQIQNRGGGIILMSSIGGSVGSGYIANYAATKAWDTIFAHGLYAELKEQHGIDALGCVAGSTLTPNFQKFSNATDTNVMIQSPYTVAEECLHALGKAPSIATGRFNKFARILLERILPLSVALDVITKGTQELANTDK